jgi:hypothetical protein
MWCSLNNCKICGRSFARKRRREQQSVLAASAHRRQVVPEHRFLKISSYKCPKQLAPIGHMVSKIDLKVNRMQWCIEDRMAPIFCIKNIAGGAASFPGYYNQGITSC